MSVNKKRIGWFGLMMALATVMLVEPVKAADGNWQAPINGTWSDTNKWTGGVVPTNGADTATFSGSSGDNPTVTLDVSPTIASTTINGGNWTFTNGVLSVGDLNWNAGSVRTASGPLWITPTAVTVINNFGGRTGSQAINGSGMTPNNPVTTNSTSNADGQGWESDNTRLPWITFDFGTEKIITGFHLWNYNETNQKSRGLYAVDLYAGVTLPTNGTPYASVGPAWGTLAGSMTFDLATGFNGDPGKDYFLTKPVTTRYLQIYATGTSGDSYAGLSEIRFYGESDLVSVTNALNIATGAELVTTAAKAVSAPIINVNGTLRIADDDPKSRWLGYNSISNAGTIIVETATDITLRQTLSGTGTLVKNNTNVLTLAAGGKQVGSLTLNQGSVKFGAGNLILPAAVTTSSVFDNRSGANMLNGSGMLPGGLVTLSSFASTGGYPDGNWVSSGSQAWMTFDFGSEQTIGGFHLWNYNCSTETYRGMRYAGLYTGTNLLAQNSAYSAAGPAWGTLLEYMPFRVAPGQSTYTGDDYFLAKPVKTRYLQFWISRADSDLNMINEIRFYAPRLDVTDTLTVATNQTMQIDTLGVYAAKVRVDGTLTLTGGCSVAGIGYTSITNSGTLTIDCVTNQTLQGAWSGAGLLMKKGLGTLDFVGAEKKIEQLAVTAGTVKTSITWASPTAVTAINGFPGRTEINAINGSGMTPNNPVTSGSTHDNNAGNMWLSNGTPLPWITFDFGAEKNITGFHLWNYNESGNTNRGLYAADIYAGATLPTNGTPKASVGPAWGSLAGSLTFDRASGITGDPGKDYFLSNPVKTRYLQIYVTGSGGDSYTGLSEIRFYCEDNMVTFGESVALTTGALLDLSGLNRTVKNLYVDGKLVSRGTWGSPSSTAPHKSTLFQGTGTLRVTEGLLTGTMIRIF